MKNILKFRPGLWEEQTPSNYDNNVRRRFTHTGMIGRHASFDNAFELTICQNSTASPPPAFGFAESDTDRSWPALTLKMSFCACFEDERDRIALAIMQCVTDLHIQGIEPQL